MEYPTYKEYERLYKKAERMLDKQVVKPAAKRDEALIEECEETMLFCAERMKALQPEKGEAAKRTLPRWLRLVGETAAALVVLLAISVPVAQASGVNIWSALIHWNKNYLRIDYSVNGDQDPPKGEYRPNNTVSVGYENEIKMISFDSEEGMREYLGSSFLYPYGMEGLEFISAEAMEDEDGVFGVEVEALYDGLPLKISGDLFWEGAEEENIACTTIRRGSFDCVEKKLINGAECVLASSKKQSLLMFYKNHGMYRLIGEPALEQLDFIAAEMLR